MITGIGLAVPPSMRITVLLLLGVLGCIVGDEPLGDTANGINAEIKVGVEILPTGSDDDPRALAVGYLNKVCESTNERYFAHLFVDGTYVDTARTKAPSAGVGLTANFDFTIPVPDLYLDGTNRSAEVFFSSAYDGSPVNVVQAQQPMPQPPQPQGCSRFNSCTTCLGDPGCGWCASKGCVAGAGFAGSKFCPAGAKWAWSDTKMCF